MNQTWDQYFVLMAGLVASKSKDPSTQVGCVIVGPDNEIRSTGFNGFPRGIREYHYEEKALGWDDPETGLQKVTVNADHTRLDEERWERPLKYKFVEHAERNAIYNAARMGVSMKGCTMYLNWQPTPCTECTKAVIQAGITRIVGPNIPFPGVGDNSFEVSELMLNEAKIVRIKLTEIPT